MMYKARLPSKPEAELSYSLYSGPTTKASAKTPRLIVCLNNLMMPAASWQACITALSGVPIDVSKRASSTMHNEVGTIPILTYDRFGQGATNDRDPLDARPNIEAGYGHDFLDVTHDLHELVGCVSVHLNLEQDPELLLVGASIGAPLARLYAQTYPGTVAGMILLDSNIANADYSTFWPDPAAADFDTKAVVRDDCTIEQYVEASTRLAAMFAFSAKNGENLDRRTCPTLLPHANAPKLIGPDGEEVKVCVVGHDPETFADEGYERMGTPRSFTKRYAQTAWEKYNEGLLQIGDSSDFPEVMIAKGCGHFIQKNDPVFVAELVSRMVRVLDW